MKTLFSVFIGMLVCTGITLAQQNNTGVIDKNVPDFDKWTKEQILQQPRPGFLPHRPDKVCGRDTRVFIPHTVRCDDL